MTHYEITFADPAGHLLEITLTLSQPASEQRLAMPTWIPGSYLIREFARHVVTLSAEQAGRAVAATKIDKATWQVATDGRAPLTVRYRVYAWDHSVRACSFDDTRGFVNPAACLLEDVSLPGRPCTLDIHAPGFVGGDAWHCATALSPIAVSERGFGRYHAENYDELIDHAIECSAFSEFRFTAGGVPHRFVVSGRHRGDLERLQADAARICQGHCDLFGGSAPFAHYLFQLHVVDSGYGGIEHRNSTALIASRHDLPASGEASISEGYLGLLELISHEYFHAWNVKRIMPAAFRGTHGYDTTRESYTRLLWLFEGFTSYYDSLMLRRVGLITDADYLKLLGRKLTGLLRSPGRQLQSAADASFDAWIKLYRADENAINAQFSYYTRGSLIALALDLQQREIGEDAPTLDDIMHGLWRTFGQSGRGVPEAPEALFSQWAQRDLGEFFARYVHGTEDPDWGALFASFDIDYETRPAASASDRGGNASESEKINTRTLGMLLAEDRGQSILKAVVSGSAAWSAGLSAGDVLVALDGLRASGNTLEKHLARLDPGTTIDVVWFRGDELRQGKLTLPDPAHDTVWLSIDHDHEYGQERRERWLGKHGEDDAFEPRELRLSWHTVSAKD